MRLLLFLLALPAFAQIESAKFHYGDDLRWADPAFDDSGWIDADSRIDPLGHLDENRYWVRLKMRVPDPATKPVIGLNLPIAEVYAEGRLFGKRGDFPPRLVDAPYRYTTWAMPADFEKGQLITIAVRIWRVPGLDLRRLDSRALSTQNRILVHPAGETPIHEGRLAANHLGQTWASVLVLVLLIFLFAAGGVRWADKEFRYLMIFILATLANHTSFASGLIFPWGNRVFAATGFFQGIAAILQLQLIAHIAGVRTGTWIRSLQALNLAVSLSISFAALLPSPPAWLPLVGPLYPVVNVMNLLAGLVILVLQRADGIMPRLLPLALVIATAGTVATRLLPLVGLVNGIRIGDTLFNANVVGSMSFATLAVIVRVHRLRRAGEEAFRLQGQLAAARGAQEMLLAGNVAESPGYRIETAYHPADEVGGDFFRILSAPENATLLIVGDVSGKGLRAAMLVSVIVGTLLNRKSNEPAAILAEMNLALAGQLDGGFVTCCAALLEADGKVTLANAGHPQPYSASGEVEVQSGLPLGIVPDATYASRHLELSADDYLTLVSDGVIEASNAQAELFGFDRTRAVSGRPASEIAAAAKTWGQNDDITVVTVRRRV